MTGPDEPTGFLYPFIEAEERDAGALLADLAASASSKIAESRRLRVATLAALSDQLATVSREVAARFAAGGRLLTFGNGGSATDAEIAADLFRHPHGSGAGARPLPASSLVEDRAVLTALANDVGIDLVFSRQLIAHGRRGDIAMGFSTSGGSANVLRAFAEAKVRGLLTVGLAGYGGAAVAASVDVDHCLAVGSQSVHRIQETQAALVHDLWARVQAHLEPQPEGSR